MNRTLKLRWQRLRGSHRWGYSRMTSKASTLLWLFFTWITGKRRRVRRMMQEAATEACLKLTRDLLEADRWDEYEFYERDRLAEKLAAVVADHPYGASMIEHVLERRNELVSRLGLKSDDPWFTLKYDPASLPYGAEHEDLSKMDDGEGPGPVVREAKL